MPKVQYLGQCAMGCLRPRRASRVTAGCEARVKAEVALVPSGGRWEAVSCDRRTLWPSWMTPGDRQPNARRGSRLWTVLSFTGPLMLIAPISGGATAAYGQE